MTSSRIRSEKSRRAPRPVVGLVVIGTALSVWWPAFTIGAWGTLFFDQLLAIWVASTTACVIVLAQPRPAHHRFRRAIALAIPSVWLLLSFVSDADDVGLLLVVDLLEILIALTGLPLTAWVLVRLFWPQLASNLPKRVTVIAAAVVIAVAVGSFALGANHPHFLTCEDFTLSGNSEPPGCVKAESD